MMQFISVVSGKALLLEHIVTELQDKEHNDQTILACIEFYEHILALIMYATDEHVCSLVSDWARNTVKSDSFGEQFNDTLKDAALRMLLNKESDEPFFVHTFTSQKHIRYQKLDTVLHSYIDSDSYTPIPYTRYVKQYVRNILFPFRDYLRARKATVPVFDQAEIIDCFSYIERLRTRLQKKEIKSPTELSVFRNVYILRYSVKIQQNQSEQTIPNEFVDTVIAAIDSVKEKIDDIRHLSAYGEEQLYVLLLFPEFKRDLPYLLQGLFTTTGNRKIPAISCYQQKFVWNLSKLILAYYIQSMKRHEKVKYQLFEAAVIDKDHNQFINLRSSLTTAADKYTAFVKELEKNKKKCESPD